MREAGFKQTRVEHLAGSDSMVIGIKQASSLGLTICSRTDAAASRFESLANSGQCSNHLRAPDSQGDAPGDQEWRGQQKHDASIDSTRPALAFL